ncbi:hydroxypyruvate isomerase family protein [Marinitenerispora sediminis]|uniref:Hydroxypyruvate isomerase n=1 Tax=Marinitenerispora sediminis TaxID=1931232 RepID=A0A368T1H5_9ACTN|nr:TIM barrel protein [Marinitenerispora sediminis]RCV52727.1 hydroxypyruvate isomerase [Marinitenerispora sediminis]RCV53690.1 hydroxypyruvate isomerase [Marinitenerispora sediminis]RCV56076.1 hydroxypyruvate isomerase [Marinitenerispora sediminis]
MGRTLRYTVNCSLLFTELPLLRRPAAARAAGFDAVEFWWPFDRPVPEDSEVAAFTAAVEDAGVQLTGLNFFAGDMPGGERGVLSSPTRAAEFRDNIAVVVEIGHRLGTTGFNALYGLREPGVPAAESDAVAAESIAAAAEAVAAIGGTVLVEPVSGAPDYPLKTAADALRVVRAAHTVGARNVALLADLFHLAANGDDVAAVVDAHAHEFGHIQIADHPGRGEPGTGTLPLDELLAAAQARGYTGRVGLEYRPTGPTTESFARLPH